MLHEQCVTGSLYAWRVSFQLNCREPFEEVSCKKNLLYTSKTWGKAINHKQYGTVVFCGNLWTKLLICIPMDCVKALKQQEDLLLTDLRLTVWLYYYLNYDIKETAGFFTTSVKICMNGWYEVPVIGMTIGVTFCCTVSTRLDLLFMVCVHKVLHVSKYVVFKLYLVF